MIENYKKTNIIEEKSDLIIFAKLKNKFCITIF